MPEIWKLNGNIFFKLFLSDLDEKNSRATNDTQKETAKQAYLAWKYIYLVAFHTKTENTV